MTIKNAEDARKLYECTIPCLVKRNIETILLTIEVASKKGKNKIVYNMAGKEEFHSGIVKELELRKFKVKGYYYMGEHSHSPDSSLHISW